MKEALVNQNSSVTSAGMVIMDSRVEINVTSAMKVVSFSYFRHSMVPYVATGIATTTVFTLTTKESKPISWVA